MYIGTYEYYYGDFSLGNSNSLLPLILAMIKLYFFFGGGGGDFTSRKSGTYICRFSLEIATVVAKIPAVYIVLSVLMPFTSPDRIHS